MKSKANKMPGPRRIANLYCIITVSHAPRRERGTTSDRAGGSPDVDGLSSLTAAGAVRRGNLISYHSSYCRALKMGACASCRNLGEPYFTSIEAAKEAAANVDKFDEDHLLTRDVVWFSTALYLRQTDVDSPPVRLNCIRVSAVQPPVLLLVE